MIKCLKAVILITLLLFCFVGCSTKSYEVFTKKFYNEYVIITNDIDIRDFKHSIKSLQEEKNTKKLGDMKLLLENIKNDIPKSKLEHYKIMEEMYKDLKYLASMTEEVDRLPFNERVKIATEISEIDMIRKNMASGKFIQ